MDKKLVPSRLSARSNQDHEAIIEVLNKTLFCTVSSIMGDKPYAIPTGFCIHEGKFMIHGSVKSHFLDVVMKAGEVCITTFIFDGLVLAASAFHHSVNYRSVVLFGAPQEVTDKKTKAAMLKTYTEKYVPGRWDSLRPINDGEIKATRVVVFDLNKASLKYRFGPPSYEQADHHLGIWTGVIPASNNWGEPIQDPNIDPGITVPEHVNALVKGEI